jgi:hypothetical protein
MKSHQWLQPVCLKHQKIEDQMSRVGVVCVECKRQLYLNPPQGPCRTFWESQPSAYSLDREPCFVFSLSWDDFQIRSLHPAGSEVDPRGELIRNQSNIPAQQLSEESSEFSIDWDDPDNEFPSRIDWTDLD